LSLLQATTTTITSTSLYGTQQETAAAGGGLDVHGSLPVLSHTGGRRLLGPIDRSSSVEVTRLLLPPKSASLHGYGLHLLSVDGPGSSSRHHHRHRHRLTAANYRPLSGQHARYTLSRLDVEYINRSQIFRIISGQSIGIV